MNTAIQYEELDGPVGVLTLDQPDSKVTTLSQAVLAELAGHVERLADRDDLQGLLFRSGKPGQFIAGADLVELGQLVDASPEEVEVGLATGHELFDRIGDLPFPVVALVDGQCLGGGTELILAMDERIASDDPRVKIVLPEVKIGLFPAWGGTQRLPRLIGLHHAIEIICSGNPVPAGRAVELGLIFDAVPADRLQTEGMRVIEILRNDDLWLQRRRELRQPLGLTENQANFSFAVANGHLQHKTKGQYPAPLAALEAMQRGLNLPLDQALKVEREVAHQVVGSEISGNLIRVFFMQNRLSRDAGGPEDLELPEVNRVGILGAGLMGSGITTAHARRGVPATMVDLDNDRLESGLAQAAHVVESRIKIGRATPKELGEMMAMISTATSTASFDGCDVVVEAVTENEELKTRIYGQLADILAPGTILASNTSTISITRMADSAPEPERFAGMHFFYPVDRMQLVEVIRGEQTSNETVATLVDLARRVGKTPIVMNDCPGFLVNRVLLPYMAESLQLLREGAAMDEIDEASIQFGMPMGPIALHDLVGLDTALYAGQVVSAAYSERAVGIPILEDLVNAGRLGKKSAAGFRQFVGRKSRPIADPDFEAFLEPYRIDDRKFTVEELQDRLFLPMLLEATRCLEEKIVREAAHVDMGVILGIGFPPFRGGLLRWCDSMGAGEVLERLEPLAALGPRFSPTDSLSELAATGGLWHPTTKGGSA